jgi:hypothetical protein
MPRADSTTTSFVEALLSATWWREQGHRLAGLFRRRRTGARPSPGPWGSPPDPLDLDVPEDTFVLETPALGDAYNFLVGIRCTWSVQGTASAGNRKRRTQEIQRLVARQRPVVREQIDATVRKAARHHAPYRAAAAEQEIGEKLQACKAEGDLHVRIRVRVDVCEAVRDDLKTVWQHRLVEDAKGDEKKATVELIGELQEAWRGLLLEGLRGIGDVQTARASWIAPYALALAQDPEQSAGVYLRDMIKHRVSHAEDLLTELSDLVVDRNMDPIEFAFGTNSALHALLRLLGVPISPQASANGDGQSTEERGDTEDDESPGGSGA